MSEIAIKVEGIGKRYRIGRKKSGDFRESFGNILRSVRSTTLGHQPETNKEFWALSDISFEVKQGEAVGIIGRNGAGKSTLLKILSRITKPTTGRFEINGRVSSLLEVGTGFHPELTGRENIFLNGTILGMRRREIKSKFDEIVAFSGVENFIDTPVKHYSSGMKVRLAFSVAAHLEPEILIIDEVLAVGDSEFQKKCLGKMEDVTGEGRTVLFVSHNMGMIKQLCSSCIWLDTGKFMLVGDCDTVIASYLAEDDVTKSSLNDHHLQHGINISVRTSQSPFYSLQNGEIELHISVEKKMIIDSLGFFINNVLQERIGIIDLRDGRLIINPGETKRVKIDWRSIPLIEGEYRLGLFLGSNLLTGNFADLINILVLGPPRENGLISYPLNVRGKTEFDYQFYVENYQG